MPPKKRVSTNPKRIDYKSNVQTVVVKVGETPKKKRRARRKRSPPSSGGDAVPMRQLPPVVYQVPAMVTGYTNQPAIMQPERVPVPITMREPVRATVPILEDIGIVGTEGKGSEIIDVLSKNEQLSDLITPVKFTKLNDDTPSVISAITTEKKVRKGRQRKPNILQGGGFTQKEIDEGLQFPTGKANILNNSATAEQPQSGFNNPKPTEHPQSGSNKPKRKYNRRKSIGGANVNAKVDEIEQRTGIMDT